MTCTVAVVLTAVACGETRPEQCQRASTASALIGGTEESTYLGLSRQQRQAISVLRLGANVVDGAVENLCSGVMVRSDVVLTAAHCISAPTAFQLEVEGESWLIEPNEQTVILHPDYDLALVNLHSVTASSSLPWLTEGLAVTKGTLVEISGGGISDQGAGDLRFAVAEVEGISDDHVIVQLPIGGGPCGGDSGGPLLVRSLDGSVRVAGILSGGAASCDGPDSYVRLDHAAAWLAENVGAPVVTTSACETLGDTGRCFGEIAVYCDHGTERGEQCARTSPCGWDDDAHGFRCVERDLDACTGVSDLGRCFHGIAQRCQDGVLQELACESCGATCEISPKTGKAICAIAQ